MRISTGASAAARFSRSTSRSSRTAPPISSACSSGPRCRNSSPSSARYRRRLLARPETTAKLQTKQPRPRQTTGSRARVLLRRATTVTGEPYDVRQKAQLAQSGPGDGRGRRGARRGGLAGSGAGLCLVWLRRAELLQLWPELLRALFLFAILRLQLLRPAAGLLLPSSGAGLRGTRGEFRVPHPLIRDHW